MTNDTEHWYPESDCKPVPEMDPQHSALLRSMMVEARIDDIRSNGWNTVKDLTSADWQQFNSKELNYVVRTLGTGVHGSHAIKMIPEERRSELWAETLIALIKKNTTPWVPDVPGISSRLRPTESHTVAHLPGAWEANQRVQQAVINAKHANAYRLQKLLAKENK